MTNPTGTRVRLRTVSRCSNGELRETFTYVSGGYGKLWLADYDASSAFH